MNAQVVGYRAWRIHAPKLEIELGPRTNRTNYGAIPLLPTAETDEWLAEQTLSGIKRQRPHLQPLGYRSKFWTKRQDQYEMHCEDGHTRPVRACSCGIYAWSRADALRAHLSDPEVAIGAILAWGHLIIHGDDLGIEGFRAQFCRILAIGATGHAGRRHVLEKAVAERYQVPLTPLKRLRQVALEFGVPLPGEWEAGKG